MRSVCDGKDDWIMIWGFFDSLISNLRKNLYESDLRSWQKWLKVGFAYVTFGSSNFFCLSITGKHGSIIDFQWAEGKHKT